ncbi:hypothetical protein [Hyphomicrobium sp.]|uniref:hypothetical protein n=1 Tax=Hyphomicrobium sp. TaxID=82 RepID=UPI000FA8A90A|nr:hypothetical protein [Hyphomicrobium sp.]RUP00674.1 MAG: hypothetical protein EKK30_01045 [Hyphomicrobium sp.]
MRPSLLHVLVCLALAMPSAALAKKKKEDAPADKLSCKQLSGRIQVSVMELRGFKDRNQASALSRGIQTGFAATFGNLSHGVNPQGDYDAKVAELRTYNQRLVEKGCKSYDLDAELRKNEIDDVPSPTIPAPKKPKAASAAPAPAPQ